MGIEIRGLQDFSDRINLLLNRIPGARRELHEQLSEMIKEEVDSAIASRVNDSRGHVRSWQARHVGSRGGYAAVRPKGRKEGEATGDDGPGAITNYLEVGFKHKRSGKYVLGRRLYANARAKSQSRAIQMASSFADDLSKQLGG